MKKINLSYENGNAFPVYIVRYFRFKNNVYLIYTLQEKDDRDYMKLYVVKIMTELNQKVSQTVRRNDEWKSMKGIIKIILTQIKKHELTCIEDLDSSELEGLIIYESKSFSIASDLVDVLAKNIDEIKNTPLSIDNIEENVRDTSEQLEILELQSEEKITEVLELEDEISEESVSEEIEVLEL